MTFNIGTILRCIGFVVTGSLLTILLLVISEIMQFTHINFVPFGGPSWGQWIYPIYFFLGFLISYILFRLPKKTARTILIAFVVLFVLSYIFTEGQLFINPIPFGVNAY